MIARELGISVKAVEKQIRQLRESGYIQRKNGRARGYWEILKSFTGENK